jgi:geranylgeranyl reductase family protein
LFLLGTHNQLFTFWEPIIFDVIVAGQGPGGAILAYELAKRGISVLGLEKAVHPRPKPCGGCLSRRVEPILDFDFRELVEDTIDRVTFTFRGEKEIHYQWPEPVAYMVDRKKWDAFLVGKAREAGAEIWEDTPLLDFQDQEDQVRVITAKGEIKGRVLAGADGALSKVSRVLGSPSPPRGYLALEGEVGFPEGQVGDFRHRVCIDVGFASFGYGWVFPRRDHLSIGLADLKKRGREILVVFKDFIRSQRDLASLRIKGLRARYIPIYTGEKGVLSKGRILLLGDAARLVDPFLGEGIYSAMQSGRIAARVISAFLDKKIPDLGLYNREVAKEFHREFIQASWLSRIAYAYPALSYRVLRKHPGLIALYGEILKGREPYGAFFRRLKEKTLPFLR